MEVPKWKRPKCPSTNAWLMKKMWSAQAMKYYLRVKKSIFMHSTAYRNPENIVISKVIKNILKLVVTGVVRLCGFAESLTDILSG